MDKKAKESKTVAEIEQKLTPLLPRNPLFSKVAPSKDIKPVIKTTLANRAIFAASPNQR